MKFAAVALALGAVQAHELVNVKFHVSNKL